MYLTKINQRFPKLTLNLSLCLCTCMHVCNMQQEGLCACSPLCRHMCVCAYVWGATCLFSQCVHACNYVLRHTEGVPHVFFLYMCMHMYTCAKPWEVGITHLFHTVQACGCVYVHVCYAPCHFLYKISPILTSLLWLLSCFKWLNINVSVLSDSSHLFLLFYRKNKSYHKGWEQER